MSENPQVIVVGGGASGLTAAIVAAQNGATVTVLEQNENPGRKICVTGNGRCNLTNKEMRPEIFRGEHPEIVQSVLKQFSMEDTLEFFGQMGVAFTDRNGWVYPRSNQAKCIPELMLLKARSLKVKIKTREKVKDVYQKDGRWKVRTEGWTYEGDRVILANGSGASQVPGSDGSGYAIAEKLGHRIIKPLPALVQLRCPEKFFKQLAGVRADASVILYSDGRKLAEDKGEVQLTDYGISGIPVFQVSRFAARALDEGRDVRAVLNFYPECPETETRRILKERSERLKERQVEDFFSGWIHKKLAALFLKQAGIRPDRTVGSLTEAQIQTLGDLLCRFEVSVNGTNSFEQAQICCGGVDVREVDAQTMESKKVKGLYFAGEILDVDGICGGYNLQWAWSSGAAAGKCAGRESDK